MIKFIFFLCAILFLSYLTYVRGLWRFNYPEISQYPVQGLDVSHHQGDIRWGEISKLHFSFVYIKATEGGDFKDKNFLQNVAGAKLAKLKVGAYHFFTLCRPGAEQAENFIQAVKMNTYDLPPAIDLEFVGNCAKRPTRDEFVKELKGFIDVMGVQFQENPMLYTTYEFYDTYLKGTEFADYPFWVRDVFKKPDMTVFTKWVYWQYADNAIVQGIDGPVDLNVMAH